MRSGGEEYETPQIRDICRIHSDEISVLKVLLEKLDISLFGGSGREGIVTKFESRLEAIENRMSATERKWWILLGVLGALQFLTGNGVISLKGFIGK